LFYVIAAVGIGMVIDSAGTAGIPVDMTIPNTANAIITVPVIVAVVTVLPLPSRLDLECK
jgi:hypothetical protein